MGHKLQDFDYELPPELIAQEPVTPRDAARLMVVHRCDGRIEHRFFYELPGLLAPGDVLVLNETRVVPARLAGTRRDTGGRVELLLLRPQGEGRWVALGRPGRRLRPGVEIVFPGDPPDRAGIPGPAAVHGQGGTPAARVVERLGGGAYLVEVSGGGDWEAIIRRGGRLPLPPYIRKTPPDPERYQTVYARVPGSVAAPTAGLHFTPRLLAALEERGVVLVRLLLHVGPGTFRPVRTEDITAHRMEAEYFCISEEAAAAVNAGRARGGRIVAVGTTTTRCLETVGGEDGRVRAARGWTDLFIYPGYRFRVVQALITNFHLPRSTLLMLVSAFAGRELILKAYREAIRERYRFYSFGDAMLIL
ncbi:MAG: tRNA preQ1(34) S-adenosylmethionine ribosyltransferase-isomerase QueA [Firmicutes bacterium]|nr:tRNA preQ1(34) S-adenosylmethionine ribosyltransferase-isomerase QueA [Bacillota bacterium]